MNYYETGKKDGASQFEMDRLTETEREGEQLAYSALASLPTKYEQMPDRISVSLYVGGFVEGYLIAIIRKHQEECEEALTLFDDIESPRWRYIATTTIQRKQYATSAQADLLQTILNEIGVEADKVTK